MVILFSTDQVYRHGGIEKVMAIKANYFAKLPDVKVIIMTTEQEGCPPQYVLDKKVEQIDLGINYDRSQSYFSKTNLKKAWKHFRAQKKQLRQLKPDVIISPNFNFDHYWLPFIKRDALLIKERHSSRYLEETERTKASGKSKLFFKINDWIDKKYDRIVVLNKDEKAYVKSGNAVVIPNPIEIPEFRVSLDAKRVIAAGRIAPVKAFDELIKSWKLIRDEVPDWELHIFGEDYEGTKKILENLIKELNLKEKVFLKDPVPDLQQTMKAYSIYAMTSETECFPMVLLEALSVGMPIVSYDCPNGPRNIISSNEDGILIENKNRKAFASALKKLINHESLRKEMGVQAKKNSQSFSVEKVMNQWNTLIRSGNV